MKENKKVQHNLDLSGKTIVNARLVNCRAEGGFESETAKLNDIASLLDRISVLDEYLGISSDKVDPALEKYFTIEATEDGTSVYFRQSSYAVDEGLDPLKVEVSTDDGVTWETITASVGDGETPGAVLATLDEGEKVLIRGKNEAYGYFSNSEGDSVENCNFYADQPCYVYGNIMSLVGGDDFARLRKVSDYAFSGFFSDYADELDYSWVLSKDGESLSLPAVTLAQDCYASLFYSCTALVQAPALPATALAKGCYNNMFNGCTSLTQAPTLPALALTEDCYKGMFYDCTSLTQAPELPATILADRCYDGMFHGCTSLTQAPELPATILAPDCYSTMFWGCTSLNYIKAFFTTTPSSSYTGNWVLGVNANGTFIKNSAATWNVTGNSGIPSGWTVKTADA